MKNKKEILSKKKLASLGYKSIQQVPNKYWNEQLCKCYKQYKQHTQDDMNQTYKQFIQMTLDGANEQGTGRFTFKDVSHIQFSIIKRKNNKVQKLLKSEQNKKDKLIQKRINKQQYVRNQENDQQKNKNEAQKERKSIEWIQKLLSTFFNIPTYYNESIKLSIDPKTNGIINQVEMVQYTNLQNFQYFQQENQNKSKDKTKAKSLPKNKQTKINQKSSYDVWNLIDLGLQIKNNPIYKKTIINKIKSDNLLTKQSNNLLTKQSDNLLTKQSDKQFTKQSNKPKHSILLFLIQADLTQNDNYLDGRATGDGVAFISFYKQDFKWISLDKQFLQQQHPCYGLPILIHECLHTLGFQHCQVWQCLMNSITNTEYLFCPSCTRKFESQIQKKNKSLIEWYKQLRNVLLTIKQQMGQLNKKSNQHKNKQMKQMKCIKMFAHILYEKDQIQSIMKTKKQLQNKQQNDIKINKVNQKQNKEFSMLSKCQYIIKSIQNQNQNKYDIKINKL